MPAPVVTRFAPSPTGALHLGNARTALFNRLYARRTGGTFLLRVEDTDAERSREEHLAGLLDDLCWLGLDWDAGPGRDDGRGPYLQSGRTATYAAAFARLEAGDAAYPCFCTAAELELSRRAQLAAGRPPRYAGTCAALGAEVRRGRLAAGERPTLRFRVPPGRDLAWDDLVRGPQRFASDDLGDFVIRRADGGAAFLFSNAVDDGAMGVTDVLRGEDHVANTPRQRLLLEALGLPAPRYGHLPLLVGEDGAPLSKRTGGASVAAVRAAGYLPAAVTNHLFRLGHAADVDGWLEPGTMAAHFRLEALGRAPARHDPAQLRHWQKEAVHRASDAALAAWIGPPVPAVEAPAFLAAVRANLVLPADAGEWARVVYGDPGAPDAAAREAIAGAGAGYHAAALEALAAAGDPVDGAALVAGLAARTGRRGRDLYRPLRAALTHRHDGPELAALVRLMGPERARARLEAARRLAAGTDGDGATR